MAITVANPLSHTRDIANYDLISLSLCSASPMKSPVLQAAAIPCPSLM